MLGRVKGWLLAVLAMLARQAARCAWLWAAAVPNWKLKSSRKTFDVVASPGNEP